MARMIMLTEEEVERMEKQRELQERAQRAVDPNALYNQRMKAAHEAAMERRRGRILANPSAETDTTLRHQVLRDEESRLAREHEMDRLGKELATRKEEAREKRIGMENQGLEAAKLHYGWTDYEGKYLPGGEVKLVEAQNADKEKQRAHELALLGHTQTFQGTQNDAERKNKLEIANLQGQSAVGVARAQAEARAADIAAKNDIEREKLEARKQIAAMRVNGQLTQAGMARLSKTYSGLLAADYSPARIRQALLDDGWTAEEIAAAQGRPQ